jgi:hypothetical protein
MLASISAEAILKLPMVAGSRSPQSLQCGSRRPSMKRGDNCNSLVQE